MPTGAILLAELTEPLDESSLIGLRERLLIDLNLTAEDFYCDGPL